MCVLSRSVVFDSCNPIDCSLPGFSGILQARILEWAAISCSRGSSQPRNRTRVSCIAGKLFTNWATREAQDFTITPWNQFSSCCPHSVDEALECLARGHVEQSGVQVFLALDQICAPNRLPSPKMLPPLSQVAAWPMSDSGWAEVGTH